ncbi:MAG TPA: DNA polymerase ligase N-terminal domain-containing protein [Tepidisphaeraceae bacterium]|nr:DNA polymerase ligase N-terminal domain-containing protein [Tepidisphaeraceae bacterium]
MARRVAPTRSLKEYQKKRDFNDTPEPSGKPAAKPSRDKKKPPRITARSKSTTPKSKASKQKGLLFCVQKHLASHLHYDFRLEHRGVLLSWAVPKGPSLNPADKRLAMRVEDHPLDYGGFEGVIPTGYGAGIVMLWDTGTWEPETDDIDAALEKGDLKFHLNGVKLKGSWVLVRTHGPKSGRLDEDGQSRTWLLIKHRDQWAPSSPPAPG